jgi:predicted nuclease of restriction endonuclease-like (RecB) superfamily
MFDDIEVRKWYLEKCKEHGWSRYILIHQIETQLYERQVISEKVNNFENILMNPRSELAKIIILLRIFSIRFPLLRIPDRN